MKIEVNGRTVVVNEQGDVVMSGTDYFEMVHEMHHVNRLLNEALSAQLDRIKNTPVNAEKRHVVTTKTGTFKMSSACGVCGLVGARARGKFSKQHTKAEHRKGKL